MAVQALSLCTFSEWFAHKNVPYLIFYRWTKFQCHTFFHSQDSFLSSYLDSWWRDKLEDLSWIKLWSNGWHEEKEGKMEIQKFEYLENKKSFLDEIKDMFHSTCFILDEIKNMFHSFWRVMIWWKINVC